MDKYKLLKEIPLLRKGEIYHFDTDTAHVFADEDGEACEYPLRVGLASYLWLLRTEKGFFKYVK